MAAAGHANPRVVRAGQRQMAKLLHAMGDVHPHALKAQLARELSRITFERWSGTADVSEAECCAGCRPPPHVGELRAKTIFCNSGFEAVEAALKTAMLTGGRCSWPVSWREPTSQSSPASTTSPEPWKPLHSMTPERSRYRCPNHPAAWWAWVSQQYLVKRYHQQLDDQG